MLISVKPLVQRFWAKVQKTATCWLWTGATDQSGYGCIYVSGAHKQPIYARTHRLPWELHYGVIPPENGVLHRCDTPACVRPDHLFLGSQLDNMADARAKGRLYHLKKTHCQHGHAFTPENTYWQSNNGRPSRVCRACRRLIDRRRDPSRPRRGVNKPKNIRTLYTNLDPAEPEHS